MLKGLLISLLIFLAAGPLGAQSSCNTAPGLNDSKFFKLIAPSKVAGGATFKVLVLMKNTGTRCWDAGAAANQHRLTLDFHGNPNGGSWGSQRVFPVPAGEGIVQSGEFATFHLQLEAPPAVGTYPLQLTLEQDGQPFGEKAPHLAVHAIEVACPSPALTTPGMNQAALVAGSLSAPAEVALGPANTATELEVRVAFQNTGTSCWQDLPACAYAVGTNSAGTPIWPAPYRYLREPGAAPVLPGESATYSFRLKTLTTASGPTPLTVKMVRSFAGCNGGPAFFGPAASTSVNVLAYDSTYKGGATFLSQDLPPVAVRGETYRARVKLRNSGKNTWTTAAFVLSVPGDDTTWTQGLPNRVPLPHDVAPNQEVTFDFPIKAPPSGSFTSLRWQVLKLGAGRFGDTTPATLPAERDMSHRIRVSGDQFLDGASELVVKGFGTIPAYEVLSLPDFDGYTFQDLVWLSYDAARVEKELRDQARLGANVVRLWAPAGVLDPDDPASVAAVCGHFDHFLDEAYKNGIRVALTLNKPNGYTTQLREDFCPGQGDFCAYNAQGFVYSMMFHEPLRDYVSERNLGMLEACGVLADPRPRLFSLELWNEPTAGEPRHGTPAEFVKHQAQIEAWQAWVLARYGSLSSATSSANWDYSPPATCGREANLLCPPNDFELCCDPGELGDPTLPSPNNYSCLPAGVSPDTWQRFANDYRVFVQEAMRATLAASLQDYRELEASHGILAGDGYLTRLSLPTIFASNRAQYDSACKGGIHVPDPWMVEGLTDYRATHIYPWNDAVQEMTFNQAASAPPAPWGYEGGGQRYHQLRMQVDYLRGGLPVVLDETGYTQLCWDPRALSVPPEPDEVIASNCSAREAIQREVFARTIEAVAQVRGNGALFFLYGSEATGVVHSGDAPRPVVADLPGLFAALDAGRALPAPPLPPRLTLDPCASNNWGRALMRSFDAYLAAAAVPGGWRSVAIDPPQGPCLPLP